MISRTFLVTIDENGAFSTEVSCIKNDPEVIPGALMINIQLDPDDLDDQIDSACIALRAVMMDKNIA
jgi:hypothetical protein